MQNIHTIIEKNDKIRKSVIEDVIVYQLSLKNMNA